MTDALSRSVQFKGCLISQHHQLLKDKEDKPRTGGIQCCCLSSQQSPDDLGNLCTCSMFSACKSFITQNFDPQKVHSTHFNSIIAWVLNTHLMCYPENGYLHELCSCNALMLLWANPSMPLSTTQLLTQSSSQTPEGQGKRKIKVRKRMN